MSIISMVLVVFVAFLAGLEGILDQFQFHQPLVACTLIGLVTGNLAAGVMLGGSLQLIALGWANIGAAVAQGVAIPLAVAGLFLTMIVRTLSVGLVHGADAAAKKGDIKGVERAHFIALFMQGARIAIPAALLLMIPAESVKSALEAMPAWLSEGMQIGGGMVVAVGYAMVINMMATREVWPFFAIGFALAAVSELTLIALGAIGVAIALIYLALSKKGGNGGGGATASSNDPIGDILEDY